MGRGIMTYRHYCTEREETASSASKHQQKKDTTVRWQKALLLIAILLSTLSLRGQTAYRVSDVPPISKIEGRYIIDPQSILSADERAELTQKIITIRDSTDIEIAVVLLHDYDRNTYESNRHFGNELFNTWRLGHSRTNKGLLILFITREDKRQFSLEIGDGLGYTLTDAQSTLVQRKVMRPLLREDHYYEALIAGMDAVVKIDQGEDLKTSGGKASEVVEELDGWGYFFLIGLPMILAILFFLKSLYNDKRDIEDLGWIKKLYYTRIEKGVWFSLLCLPVIPVFILFLIARHFLTRRIAKDIVCPNCQAVNKVTKSALGCSMDTKRNIKDDDTYTGRIVHTAYVECKVCGAVWDIQAYEDLVGVVPKAYTQEHRRAFESGQDWKLPDYSRSSDSWGGGSDSGGYSSGGGSSSDY